ncbi:MAG: tRNA pseudouridine(55) synthase TruB [Lachnospiraceae bacterium]|jgi:tRNA pseudouridine55 synthase|nr:tRNA pseudouridine(55) synthase TruB [Lachnospiraceae bacterium]
MNGIINIYKEKGYTSHDVVAKMRGILKMKKIGHTGTLDPDAEGVLPVCIGKATKLVDLITDKDKTYEAVLKLGITTDTQDITGTVLKTKEVTATPPEIEAGIKGFIGEYMQLPPMYSAIKVNGKRLYELARQGKEVERKRRKVSIHDIRILEMNEEAHEVTMAVDCGKGTYIRTLLHDIGETLGCGGTMKSLTRTAVGSFKLEDAYPLAEIEELVQNGRIETAILPTEDILSNYLKVTVAKEYNKLIYNGNAFYNNQLTEPVRRQSGEWVRVYDSDDHFIGIYQYDFDKAYYRPVKMFL